MKAKLLLLNLVLTAAIWFGFNSKFEVPNSWVDCQINFLKPFQITPWQPYGVKSGLGDWDTEYASSTNLVLPFYSCPLDASIVAGRPCLKSREPARGRIVSVSVG